MTLADSHCHLPLLPQPASEALSRARKAGVGHFLCVSVAWDDYPAILRLCEHHPDVAGSVGVHPNEEDAGELSSELLAERATAPGIAAIGETGLDYYRGDGSRERQQERFRQHIRAARLARRPLIIHCREAWEDTLSILSREGAEETGGVMHCFTGGWEEARRSMQLNFAISFSGILTFKNAGPLREVARRIPDERLLLETDAPYLAPVPHRGKANEPALLPHTAECLAQLRGESPEELAHKTTTNYLALFSPGGTGMQEERPGRSRLPRAQ